MTPYKCRKCGALNAATSKERIFGYSSFDTVHDLTEDKVEFNGWTDVDWDSSATVGWYCLECSELTESLSELIELVAS